MNCAVLVGIRASVLFSGTSEKSKSPSGGVHVDHDEEFVEESCVGLVALNRESLQRQQDLREFQPQHHSAKTNSTEHLATAAFERSRSVCWSNARNAWNVCSASSSPRMAARVSSIPSTTSRVAVGERHVS